MIRKSKFINNEKALIPLLYIFVGTFFGMMLTRSCSKPKEIVTEIVKTDTLTIARVDTIAIEKPVPYKEVVRDTIYLKDTTKGHIFVQEIKEYKDTTYYAKISGINAFLEEIRVYPRTITKYVYQVEKVTEKPKKWGVGPQVGIGVVNNKFYPYIGFGVTYNLIQF